MRKQKKNSKNKFPPLLTWGVLFCLGCFFYFLPTVLYSQPYWNPDRIENWDYPYPEKEVLKKRDAPAESIDQRISYPHTFSRITDFHRRWQLMDADSIDLGGMIEAESGPLRDVIQTDNTQEVIESWCLCKNFFSDDDYDTNIALAWRYVENFPAYDEEVSSSGSHYYPYWNCGLALLTEMKYREIFDDSSYFEYADSCAEYIVNNPLSLSLPDSNMRLLHYLVSGFVSGPLYKFGKEVGNETYIDEALALGDTVKDWLEDSTGRHFEGKIWAMSSGTAIWGILNSYFQEHPEAGSLWIESNRSYFPEVFLPPEHVSGDDYVYTWDNSWNIWLANAYYSAYEFSGDTAFRNEYRRILNYLLTQDNDKDGGIPASRLHADSMDMSWVTAYTVIFGFGQELSSLPGKDLGVTSLQTRTDNFYTTPGESLYFNVGLSNFGSEKIENFQYAVSIGTLEIFRSRDSIDLGESITYDSLIGYSFDSAGDYKVQVKVDSPGDSVDWNDTLSQTLHITPVVPTSINLSDSSEEGVTSKVIFQVYSGDGEKESYDSLPVRTDTVIQLPALSYNISFEPRFPYVRRVIDSIEFSVGGTNAVDIVFNEADILLADNDGGDSYEIYYQRSLDSLNISYYHWDLARYGFPPLNRVNETDFESTIWFTGDTFFTIEGIVDSLRAYLNRGERLIISGQNIAEAISGERFLENYFGSEYVDNTSGNALNLVESNPVVSISKRIVTSGVGSAGNQDSKDILSPTGEGQPIFYYGDTTEVGAVYIDSSYKLIFCGFGLEGIGRPGELPSFASRAEILDDMISWLAPEYFINYSRQDMNSKIDVYPNPFSESVNIQLKRSNIKKIDIYDISGNFIRTFKDMDYFKRGKIIWDGLNYEEKEIDCGVYYLVIKSEKGRCGRKIIKLN